MRKLSFITLSSTVLLLTGCVGYEPETWINRGHVTIDASGTGRIYCYDDANLINGERIVGTLCGTPTSGFWMQGEPEISFGPWNRKFMKALVSETTQGVARDYKGKSVLLKCSSVLNENNTEIGHDCTVTISEEHLVSAKFIFKQPTDTDLKK
ncbi:hypothetical protein D9M68_837470 [compost metagenome]